MKKPLGILIVDREVLFAQAVADVISADANMSVVAIVASRDAIPAVDFDIVIIDIDSEDIAEIVDTFKNRPSPVRICALSSRRQGDLMERCIVAGIDAYLLKDSSLQELLDAIKTLGAGDGYADPRMAASLLRSRSAARGSSNGLSPRQRDIVRLVAQGLSNRDIAGRLSLSEKTVKNHVSQILEKLHCRVRSQAAVHAIRVGLA